MTPGQHFIISWVVANSAKLDRRSRVGITVSGIFPDVDGLGYVVDKVNLQFDRYSTYYADYHHYIGHNLFAGLLVATIVCCLCQRKLLIFALSLLAFHLHLLADLAGSKGMDGYQWPIYYLFPLKPEVALTWEGQWLLSSWINSAIGVGFFIVALLVARYRHLTFFEFFSIKAEKAVAKVAWQRKFFSTCTKRKNGSVLSK